MEIDTTPFDYICKLDGAGGATVFNAPQDVPGIGQEGITWLDISQSDKAAMEWLQKDSGIDKRGLAVLRAGETRPRSIDVEGGSVVVLRGVNMNPGADPDDMVAVRVWISQNLVITSHRRRVLSLVDIRDELTAGRGPKTTGEFLILLLERLASRIGTVVRQIEDALDEIEETMTEADLQELRTTLAIHRRQTASIKRFLIPQRDALERLYRQPPPVLTETDIGRLREEADHITRFVEDLELSRENAVVAQEELLNRVVEEQSSRMYVLSVVAAVFLPLTFVTGLLGMNVAGLPGTQNPSGFIFSVLTMAALGIALLGYFKWRKWL